MALAVVEADGLDAREGVERVARQTVESCPPENSTRAPGVSLTYNLRLCTGRISSFRSLPAWAKEGALPSRLV